MKARNYRKKRGGYTTTKVTEINLTKQSIGNIPRKKVSRDILVALIGVFLFFTAYIFDGAVASFFKGIKIGFLDAILGVATHFGAVIVVMLIIPSIIFCNNKKLLRVLWLSFTSSVLLSVLLKVIFARQRPMPLNYVFDIFNLSFPSTHSMVAFSLLPVITDNYKFSRIFVVYAATVAFSRVYFSVHYLSDIVFGVFFGYVIGSGVYRILKNGQRA